jgi:hypothetical protein
MRSILILFLTGLIVGGHNINAQIPVASSARTIPTDVGQSDSRVNLIIARAEDHFRNGKIQLENNQREKAREEFDKAVDTILESGFDVRASQKLQTFYVELVERIYREEAPLQQPPIPDKTELVAQNTQTKKEKTPPAPIGFRHQKVIPSPTDDLSKLVLRPEIQTSNNSSFKTNAALGDLRLEFLQSTRDYKASLTSLIQLYESNIRQAEEKLALTKKLYSEGLVLETQFEEATRGIERAREKVIETRKQIAAADKQIAAALVEVERSRPVNHSSAIGQIPHQLADGRVPTVVRYLEDNLNDPYSMKLLKWSRVRKVYLANRQPYWYVTLRLRAKNGFGAYILKEAGFYLRYNKVVFADNL